MDLSTLGSNPIFTGALGSGLVLGTIAYARAIPARIFRFFLGRMTTTIAVHSGDSDQFHLVASWLTERNLSRWSQSYRLRDTALRVRTLPGGGIGMGTRRQDYRFDAHYGRYWFWWCGRLCNVHIWQEAGGGNAYQQGTRDFMELRVFGRGVLESFNTELDELRASDKSDGIKVEPLREKQWDDSTFRLTRATSPVLKRGQLEAIEADMHAFKAGEDAYLRRGIPYRRGYLFYGPPGTGKTSLIRHLALSLKMPIVFVTMNHMLKGIADALSIIDPGSMVVIEDVDRMFAQAKLSKTDGGESSLIDLAGFLNATDGIGVPHGLVIVMTVNNLDNIAPAVLRPGRIDQRYLLDNVDAYQADVMFERFFGVKDPAFATACAEANLSPAQVQEILVRAQGEPANAIIELHKEVRS